MEAVASRQTQSKNFIKMHVHVYQKFCHAFISVSPQPVVKVDRRIRWHYTTTILRLRIGARLTRYQNCKFHNFARSISRHADGISWYSVPPSAGPLLPLSSATKVTCIKCFPDSCIQVSVEITRDHKMQGNKLTNKNAKHNYKTKHNH